MPLDFDKIKTIRTRRKLTQVAAAKLAGLTSSARWNDIERGRDANVTIQTLDAIAKALGVKSRDLLK